MTNREDQVLITLYGEEVFRYERRMYVDDPDLPLAELSAIFDKEGVEWELLDNTNITPAEVEIDPAWNMGERNPIE